MIENSEPYLREALALAYANAEKGGRPFGAVIVRDGEIVARAVNEILATGDPTSHAELNAIRLASKTLGPDLGGCAVFASGHPCPMCMAAMRLAGIGAVTYAYSNEDGEAHGLSTAAIYEELARPFAEQTMEIRHLPVRLAGMPDLYSGWRQRQG
jgi:guanine deaminase